MHLGGFVIHGNNADTLAACLDSLLAVCDEVVAVDSESTDGSAELVRARNVRTIVHPWRGYGAARAVAADALRHCDYLFFLDSDERLADGAVEAFRAWRESSPALPYYTLRRRDWADLPGGRFLFRTETRKRVVKPDFASWSPSMIVHEALPKSRETGRIDAIVDHRFATELAARAAKEERYALLWALQAHVEGRRAKAAGIQQPVHFARNAILKGALVRGGWPAARLSWAVAANHRRKYEILRDIEHGAHAELVTLMREGRYAELFARLPR